MIFVENKKCKPQTLKKRHPNALVVDVTSTSPDPSMRVLSPFYPHFNVRIPFTSPEEMTATCVEAVWQGLKVFQSEDIDLGTLRNASMQNIKRTARRFGQPLGHRKGIHGTELLNYYDARMLIYLPTYKWVLDNIPTAHNAVMRLKELNLTNDIVLLDYNTNTEFRDISKPISHAGLIKLYIEGVYPTYEQYPLPLSEEERLAKKKDKKGKAVNTNLELTLF